jgi:hypothetical protein
MTQKMKDSIPFNHNNLHDVNNLHSTIVFHFISIGQFYSIASHQNIHPSPSFLISCNNVHPLD